MNPRSSPTRACQLPLVGLAFLQRRIQGKASWIKGSYSSPGKNHGSEAALWPLSTHAWLSCTAKPPLTVIGTAEPNTPHAWPQCCSASLLQEPGDPSFSLLEPGRKLSPVGHCCSRGAKLGQDADLLLMLFETLESISKEKPRVSKLK